MDHSSAAPAYHLSALADVSSALLAQGDSRDLSTEFNYVDRFPPFGTHALLNNVSLISVHDLRTGNMLPILRGSDWDDISIVGFYQVVQGTSFGRTFIQLTSDIAMPPLGIILNEPPLSVYVINNYGLLNLKIKIDKNDITELEPKAPIETDPIRPPTSHLGSGLFASSSHGSSGFSSKSISQQKEEAKFVALKRIYFINEAQTKAFVGSRFSVDDHTTSTSCIMRLQSSLRDLPAFSLGNMASLVTTRFSHIRGIKNAWHIDLMVPTESGYFRSITGVFHAVINVKLAFQQIFQDMFTKEPNHLIDQALAQWEQLLLNQDASTSFKHLRLEYIVDELMMSLCKMAQMFNDPKLDGVKDRATISKLLADATKVDEAEIMRKGTFLLITDQQKRDKTQKPANNSTQPNKKQRTDTPRSSGGGGKPSPGNSSSTSSTVATPQGRGYTQPCLNNIQHLVIGAPYEPCRNEGKTCKYEFGPLPVQFDSPAHKSFVIKSTNSIRNEKTRGVVQQHLEGIPAKP